MSARGCVVTGGTGALGGAVVRALVSGGARVAVPYRREEKWHELRASVPGATLWGARADLGDAREAERFMAEAAEWLAGLDGVALVAGGFRASGRLEQAPVEEWTAMLTTNLGTAYGTCRAAIPRLRPGGSVVTVASRLATEGGTGAAAYAVSKAGVMTLTRVLAAENRDRGLRFNCVVPGIIDTEANRAAMPQADPRTWTPAEAIARVVAFLLSPESAPLTGAVLPVDGPV